MNKLFIFASIGLFSFVTGCQHTEVPEKPEHRIIIEATISPDFKRKAAQDKNPDGVMRIQYTPFHYIAGTDQVKTKLERVINDKITWVIYSDKDLLLTPPFAETFIVHPGDSINILYNNDKISFSGNEKNTATYALISKLNYLETRLVKPDKDVFNISSLEEFLQWNRYIDKKLAIQIALIDSFRNKLPDIEYNYYKPQLVGNAESDRSFAFSGLLNLNKEDSVAPLSNADLNAIWDSTQYKNLAQWVRSQPEYSGSIQDIYSFLRLEVQRKFNFDFSNDTLKNKELRTFKYYMTAKNNFKGLMRERLLAFILDEQVITEMGPKNPMTQTLLKDYYSQPGYPEYKQWVKQLEEASKSNKHKKFT